MKKNKFDDDDTFTKPKRINRSRHFEKREQRALKMKNLRMLDELYESDDY